MSRFVKKYKFIILANFFIFLTYFLFLIVPESFGVDNYSANSYANYPGMNLYEMVSKVIDHAITWNARIGETYLYAIGNLPPIISYILTAARYTIFLNLIYFLIYGKNAKKLFTDKTYLVTLLTSHLATITLFPGFGEILIWLPGAYNYIFGMNILLMLAINYRLILDDVYILENRPALRFIYYILAFLAGFTLENTAPCFFVYIAAITFIKARQNKTNIKQFIREKYYLLIQIALFAIGLLTMFLLAKSRIDFFSQNDWTTDRLGAATSTAISYIPLLIIFVVTSAILLIRRNKKKQELQQPYLHLFAHLPLSIASVVIVMFLPIYFVARTTIYLYITALMVILLFVNTYLKTLATILFEAILILIVSVSIFNFYQTFNDFNEFRKNYILKQYDEGETHIICPIYMERSALFKKRLYDYQYAYCDIEYIKILLNDKDITVEYKPYGFQTTQ